MSKYSFVTVSNRLPLNVTKTAEGLHFEVSSGGLATAMSSIKKDNSTWVGWCGIPNEDLTSAERRQIKEEFAKHNASPVFLSHEHIKLYYDGYSNDTLWPLFHYFQSVARYDDRYFQAYQEVNQAFRDVIKRVSASDAMIWVQDYHLMLLPGLIKQSLPRVTIGFFLHIPFPSFEIFRLLPERKAILNGLLGADVIGFHIFDYSQHFVDSCRRLVGVSVNNGEIEFDGRIIHVGAYPIGIDMEKFKRTLSSKPVEKHRRRIMKRYYGQKIILSIDRLDYSKGIPQRLEAFRQLLEKYPEHRGSVILQMVAVPSRVDVGSYQKLRDEIERTVSRINGMYGTVDWTPIAYQFQNRPFDEIVALYATADIMLVTPIRDGMNLVAKEYVACKPRSQGVLILSEMTGAIDELPEAISINPNSAGSIAKALHKALLMPKKEQQDRLKHMRSRLKEADIYSWSQTFVADMERAASGGNRPADRTMNHAQYRRLVADFRSAKRRLLILDYDGTLKPFTSSPTTLAGFPSLRLRWTLHRLSTDPATTVAIVSGRSKNSLGVWFKGLNVELAGEHGAWTRIGGHWRKVENHFKKIKKPILQTMQQYALRTEGATVEEKEYALVWHYRSVEPGLAFSRASKLYHELSRLLIDEHVGVHMGDKIIEVKQNEVNKGRVVDQLMKEYDPDFVLCAGDDYTDEDMFKALRGEGYSFKIGEGDTSAKYRFNDISEVIELLTHLQERRPFKI